MNRMSGKARPKRQPPNQGPRAARGGAGGPKRRGPHGPHRGYGANRPPRPPIVVDPEAARPPQSTLDLLDRWGDRADAIRESLTRYVVLILEGNARANLTGAKDPQELWRGHIEDALHGATLLETHYGRPTPETRILDVGSGGGLPGIVWAILWPKSSVTLLDAREKKCAFLEAAAKILHLGNVEVVCDRAEIVAHRPDRRERYDWVTARALAPLAVLAEWTFPFAKWGGRVFAVKAAEIGDELDASKRAYKLLGAPAAPRLHDYTRADGKACLLVAAQKVGMTPSPYPRREGVATAKPL